MKNNFSILLAGDFFLTEEFLTDNLISDEIITIFEDADYRVINLEAPIMSNVAKNEPILNTGPNLCLKQEVTIPLLKKLNIDLVTLANNHIMDLGSNGLLNTIDKLKRNSIDHVGAGRSLAEAEKPFVIHEVGITISILNFAENEWANAEVNKSGANPLDIISNINQIKKAKVNSDYVIVIIHGGHEYYHYPSPRMKKQYRFYAENGADAIIGHHTHCIGGYEIYKEVPIFYSLGNFLFTLSSDKDIWYTGMLVKLSISKKSGIKFELFPIEQNRNSFMVRLLIGAGNANFFDKLSHFNNIIADQILLQKKWDEFVVERSMAYLELISPVNAIENRYLRFLLRKMGFDKFLLGNNYMKLLLNLIRCEAHADITKNVISNNLNDAAKLN
jgi:poly-gamma-glutamate capsule biosynthesis protein CapA/YwtB (metallophosphatase superfamily)